MLMVGMRNSSEGGYLVSVRKFIIVCSGVLLMDYGLLLQKLRQWISMKLRISLRLSVISCFICCVGLLFWVNQGLQVQLSMMMLIYGSIGYVVLVIILLVSLIIECWWIIVYGMYYGEFGVRWIGLSRLCRQMMVRLIVNCVGCGRWISLVSVIMFMLIVQIIWSQNVGGGSISVCVGQVKLIMVSLRKSRNSLCFSRNLEIFFLLCDWLQSQVDRLVRVMKVGVQKVESRWVKNSLGLVVVVLIGLVICKCRNQVLWIWLISMNSIIRLCSVLMVSSWVCVMILFLVMMVVVGKVLGWIGCIVFVIGLFFWGCVG